MPGLPSLQVKMLQRWHKKRVKNWKRVDLQSGIACGVATSPAPVEESHADHPIRLVQVISGAGATHTSPFLAI